ncbi:hypothetical protein H1R20_g7747, partial [Candolleomyces eurysporus]
MPLAGKPVESQPKATQDDEIRTVSGVPVVRLQTETVTDVVAARMAISLLGHVLFLKNQIPLPVPQLTRIPSKSSTSKGAKQRAELLSSFDTLTSHLTTTFTALSIALAKTYSEERLEQLTAESGHHLDRAYVAVVLGPGLGTAKSRTFLAVDRFEAKLWGFEQGSGENDDGQAEEEAEDDDEGSDCSTDDEEEGEDDEAEADDDPDAEGPEASDSEDDEDEIDSASEPDCQQGPPPAVPLPLQDSTLLTKLRTSMSPPPSLSYAEEQRFLQNSERLLSRVLATADAEGYGFASEMAPTQTHILLRAPRRFVHPAWIPRQNLTPSLESSLQDFIRYSTTPTSTDGSEPRDSGGKPGLKKAQKQRPEGVWVTTAQKSIDSSSSRMPVPEPGSNPPPTEQEKDDDEMIWWSWDGGKIVGFLEW